MTRPAFAASTIPVRARVHLKPNGDHVFEAELGMGGNLFLGEGDVGRLRRAIEAFETEVRIDDGHNNRINSHIKLLGEF